MIIVIKSRLAKLPQSETSAAFVLGNKGNMLAWPRKLVGETGG